MSRYSEWLEDNIHTDDVVKADGLDQAIVGIATIFNQQVIVYDREKAISIIQGEDMDWLEAEEYFEFNTAGAYVGPGTPAFIEFAPWVTVNFEEET